MRSRSVSFLMITLLALAACSRQRPAAVSPTAGTPTATAPAPAGEPQPAVPSAPTRSERVGREVTTDGAPAALPGRTAGLPVQRVFFDLDSYAVRTDARDGLEALALWLRANPSARLVVGGHADERGSDEYNLALGLRRANAVRRYLADFGITAERIEVRSFGEEQPLVAGHDESAWSQNRRAEFVLP